MLQLLYTGIFVSWFEFGRHKDFSPVETEINWDTCPWSVELTANSSDIQLARDMWCQILKNFELILLFVLNHILKISKGILWIRKMYLGFYNQNMTWNIFHVFYILLHATPQTHLEQAVPLYLSTSWVFWWAGVKASNESDCPQFEKHYSALHILIITFSIRELESVPHWSISPLHFLYLSYLKNHHISNYISFKNSQWLFFPLV